MLQRVPAGVPVTLGELRAALAGHNGDDDVEVLLRVQDDDGGTTVGWLRSLALDPGCTDVVALVLDGDQDEAMVTRPLAQPPAPRR
jgi:hypothetical protein